MHHSSAILVANNPPTHILGLKLITLVHPVMLHIVGGMADRLINHEWSGSIQAVPTTRHYPHHGVFCKPRPIQRPCPVLSPYSAGQFKLGQIGQLDSDIQWQLIVGSPVLTGSPGALFFGSSPYDMLMRRHGQEQKTQLVIKLVLCTSHIWAFFITACFRRHLSQSQYPVSNTLHFKTPFCGERHYLAP